MHPRAQAGELGWGQGRMGRVTERVPPLPALAQEAPSWDKWGVAGGRQPAAQAGPRPFLSSGSCGPALSQERPKSSDCPPPSL